MAGKAGPDTPATRCLEERGIAFVRHLYDYEERGGAKHAASCLGVPDHAVVKTLVMRDDGGRALLVLMHGDRRVSAKRLARTIGVRRVVSCSPAEALRATGYVVGGISPFGTRSPLPVYAEASILALERIFINGGRRGLLLELAPEALEAALPVRAVSVAADSAERGA